MTTKSTTLGQMPISYHFDLQVNDICFGGSTFEHQILACMPNLLSGFVIIYLQCYDVLFAPWIMGEKVADFQYVFVVVGNGLWEQWVSSGRMSVLRWCRLALWCRFGAAAGFLDTLRCFVYVICRLLCFLFLLLSQLGLIGSTLS